MTRLQVIPQVSEHELVEIDRIGKLRAPTEACGLLLSVPHHGRTVIELPNRSLTAEDHYEFKGSDAYIELKDYDDELVVWHTHPGGLIGPSRDDMRTRHEDYWYLVVTLTPEGPVPTFF